MKREIVNCIGQKVNEYTLDPSLFDVADRSDILHQIVVWQNAKARAGSHCTKSRGEINGSTRKEYKQKGTGRARMGDGSSPHCRGGGVAFGPKPRDYSYKINKKVRKLGLKIAISQRQKEGRLLLVDGISEIQKTAEMVKVLSGFLGSNHRKALIISADNIKSVQNLAYANSLPIAGLNVRCMLNHDLIIIDAAVINKLEERLK
jgi:large subunit ribosomal protein L4